MPISDRTMIGRIAANTMHSQGKTNTGPARRKFLQRFDDEVDPDRILPPEVRAKRAESARRAYMGRLSRKAAETRRQNREQKGKK